MTAYYRAKTLDASMEDTEDRVTQALASEGFGVLTRIDVRETLKKKLGEDISPYVILGACNPKFAHRALTLEDKIGTMLPCNVVLRSVGEGSVEVAAVDPVASMGAIENEALGEVAEEVRNRLNRVVDGL